MAISIASTDEQELMKRRDGIVAQLYSTTEVSRCRNCDFAAGNANAQLVKATADEETKLDPYGGILDEETKWLILIIDRLQDSDQSKDNLVNLLQSLADMNINSETIKLTCLRLHVNPLKKHLCPDVKRLAEELDSKWKETEDHHTSTLKVEDDNTLQENITQSSSKQQKQNGGKDMNDLFASSRERVIESYKKVQNDKRHTVQISDIYDIPTAKRTSFGKSKFGGSPEKDKKTNGDLSTGRKK